VKHYNIIKKLFLVFIFIYSFLYTQEVSVSSETLDIQEEIQSPLFFKFYHLPEYLSPSPSVEYEDIVVPYNYMITPQVEKISLAENMFSLPQQKKNMLFLFLGENKSLGFKTKNTDEHKNFEFNIQFDNTKVSYFDENKQYVRFNNSFIYNHIFDTLVLSTKLKTESNYVTDVVRQYYIDVSINKVLFNKLELMYIPQVIIYANEELNKVFFINTLSTNFLYKNFIFGFENKIFEFDSEENSVSALSIVLKDVILSGNLLNFVFSKGKNDKLYYKVNLGYKTKNFEFDVVKEKKFFYEYIDNYFIKFPYIKIYDTTKLFFTSVESDIFKCGYKSNNFYVSILFDKSLYTKYPTYVFRDDKVEPLFIDNNDISSVKFETKVFFVEYELNYLLSSDDVLFYPKFVHQLSINKDIFENIYFLIKLLYNSKTKVATGVYTEENFVTELKIGYNVKEKYNIELLVSQQLNNNYVLQPKMVVSPYIQAGLNFQF